MTLRDHIEEARAAYGIVVDEKAFAEFLAPRDTKETACFRDLALAHACLSGDASALTAFEQHIISPLRAQLARLVPDPAERDDVIQQTRAKLLVAPSTAPGLAPGLPRLASYSGAGALQPWTHVVAVRIALSDKRAKDRESPLDEDTEIASAAFDGDPELAAMKRDRRDALRAAVRAAFATLTVRERNLLRQSYIDGLSIDELGALYSVHRATAARWIAQARESVWNETRRLFLASTSMSGDEAESLMSLLQSRLDITLSGLLR